ncbi:hypothetical protein M2113_001020 [Aurantimicrobium minutum]|uniref:YqaJ viral recombinase family protein n=1 Tax=Aurantimicrobium minutum TaxID=708131 RepID=UPI002472FA64|nr:YqaJ viral recombinase family protein [Aurantimicrobium minutum]MDH6410046.1 hypothetical protein [Aurantimicrobium minutum]
MAAFEIRKYCDDSGAVVDSGTDKESWLKIRRSCVGATDARKLVKLNGQRSKQWDSLLEEKVSGRETYFFESFERGLEREPIIASWVEEQFPEEEFTHNSFLLHGDNERHVATPDMVGKDSLCEIKVSTSSLQSGLTTYRDQLQWQLHVTGADYVLFVVENRHSEEIEYEWVERNQERIDVLAKHANLFLDELDQLSNEGAGLDPVEQHFENAKSSNFYTFEDSTDEEFSNLDYTFLEVQTEKTWTKKEITELVARYCLGQNITRVANLLSVEPRLVGIELAKCVLGQQEPLIDESAANFGTFWSADDIERLTSMYRLSFPISEIATGLGRDVLGVSFQILNRFSPPVPKKILKKYGLFPEVLELMAEGFNARIHPLHKQINSSHSVRFLDFKVGDSVLINSGSFAGLMGEVGHINKQTEIVTVVVSLFETDTPVQLGFDEVVVY